MHEAMPQVTAEHRRLHALAGTWTAEEKLYPSPWDAKGGTAKSRVEAKVAVDGFFVVMDYSQEREGKVGYRGHGVFGYDAGKKKWSLHWFDSMGGMPPETIWGAFSGDTLTYEHVHPHGHSRYVYRFEKDGRYHFSILASQDGKAWQPFIEGTFTRAGAR